MNNKSESNKPLILGICASPRSGRWSDESNKLIEDILKIKTEDDLKNFLMNESAPEKKRLILSSNDDGTFSSDVTESYMPENGDNRKRLSNSEVLLARCIMEWKRIGM